MSDFSLTLVLQIKSSKIINGMAKVSIKYEKITPFGGKFHVREQFSRHLSIDESMYCGRLYTFVSNKDAHGGRGTIIAIIAGVKAATA